MLSCEIRTTSHDSIVCRPTGNKLKSKMVVEEFCPMSLVLFYKVCRFLFMQSFCKVLPQRDSLVFFSYSVVDFLVYLEPLSCCVTLFWPSFSWWTYYDLLSVFFWTSGAIEVDCFETASFLLTVVFISFMFRFPSVAID